MDPLGLPLSTFLYLTFATWYLNRSRWLTALVIGLITAAVSYYVFIRLLGLSFPAGFLLDG
jgi:putative tricarboxylic transport membrane protein